MDVIRVMVINSFKESFYGEKKTINILTTFSISHKSDVKTFLKQILNYYPKDTHQYDSLFNQAQMF